MVRNAGKFGKAKRGGGRHFSRDLSRLDADGNSVSKGGDSSSEEDSSEEESDENPQERIGQLPPIADSDSEEDTTGLVANLNSTLSTAPSTSTDDASSTTGGGSSGFGPARTGAKLTADQVAEARKARKAQAKKGTGKAPAVGEDPSDSEEEEEVNENKKTGKNMKIADLGAPKEMSRREREQAEKLAAKERYAKMHAAGKTDEAKADLGRLAEIRKQRELAAARRKAETDAKDAAAKAALEKSGKRAPLKR